MRMLVPAAAIAMLAIAPATSVGASPDPQAAVLAPLADGLVSSASPQRTFGHRTRLLVRGRPAARSVLAFDLGAERSPVAGAVLWVRVVGQPHGRLVVRRVSSRGWSERRLTWRSRPALRRGPAARSERLRRGWIPIDVTRVLRRTGRVALALTTSRGGDIEIWSRESRIAVPRLVVAREGDAAPGGILPPVTAPLASVPGKLHATASEPFVDDTGRPVRLYGLNLPPLAHGSSAPNYSAAQYAQIHAKGFNAVRMVLFWPDLEPAQGQFNQAALRNLDAAIAAARAAGLYVVLDEIHQFGYGGFDNIPAWARNGDAVQSVQTNGIGFVRMLAARYRTQPGVAAYDPVNEPYRAPSDYNGVLRMYSTLIAAIRSVDPGTIVTIEPSFGDTSIANANFSNLKRRDNVVYQLHDYFAGDNATGYNADGNQAGTYTWDGSSGYAHPNPAQLEAHLRVHIDKLRPLGIPIWVGEFGIGEGAVNRDRWIADQLALFRRYGLGYAWWEYHTDGAFSATNTDFSWRPYVGMLVSGGGG